MSSGSHLSKDLHDLIKSIGETRSKQEEDKIITKELVNLKTKLQEKNIQPKKMKEHLIRAIYIEMLGHDASFAHIQAVNLTQSKILQLKKMGYLCCSLFLDSDNQLLILLVATLQRDLASSNLHEVVIALTAVSKLINQSFVSALVDPVTKLLNHPTDIIRKKSLMVLQKIKWMSPTSISDADYEERMRRSLQDKETSVMGAALNLYHEELKRGNVTKYKGMTSNFVSLLKQIIEHKLHKDFDYHRIPAPWYQIKLLQILSILGANDLKVSEQIYEVLGSTLRRADDTNINIGYAVTYQCVKTIASIYPSQNLLEQAANGVSRFLKSDNNNLKYLGINALIQIVGINPKHVVEHQLTIVDCLESSDDTLKKETLELLFKMTNESNVEVILSKLITFLKSSSDPAFRKDLFGKISQLNENHAPTQEWFIRTANTVFEFGSEFIDNEVLNNYIRLMNENYKENGNEFGEFIIDIYIDLLEKPNLSDNMVKLIVWVIGEIGSQTYENDPIKLNELTNALLKVFDNVFEDALTVSWGLSALAKLQASRKFSMFDQVRAVFTKFRSSKYLDRQQRSLDYVNLAKYNAALKKSAQIVVDKNLSFLSGFVSQELARGAQPYNSSLSMKAVGLGGTVEAQQLHFEPYKDEKYLTKQTGGKGASNDENTGIKVTGKTIWTKDGRIEDTPPVVPVKPAVASNTMGIGSSIDPKSSPAKPQSSMVSMSSQQYQGSGNTQTPSTGITTTQTYNPTYKPAERKEDPQAKEKQILANSLFGGLTTKSQTPSTGVGNKKPVQTTVNIPQKQNLNLLDFDDPKPQQQQQQQQVNLFDSPPILTKNFKAYQITVEQYEKHWETLQNQKSIKLKTSIKSEKDFKSMIDALGISIVEVIQQEIICAGQNQSSQVVLLYGTYSATGDLELELKAGDARDLDVIVNTIRKQFS